LRVLGSGSSKGRNDRGGQKVSIWDGQRGEMFFEVWRKKRERIENGITPIKAIRGCDECGRVHREKEKRPYLYFK